MLATTTAQKSVASIAGVTRRFGRLLALNDVTFEIPQGCVFGLVGENGAGKTSLIKMMLGLLRPNSGAVKVFGTDPVRDPEGVLGRIGYLSEDRDLPDWMRIWELIRYTRAFHPNWDDAFAQELLGTFGLDLNAKIGKLSRGQRAQAGLLVALAHRPPLLLLDEPSSGLDAAVRRDILGAIIRTVAEEGRTVLFSSHLLDEVERVADHIAMIHQGKLVLNGPLDQVRGRHHRMVLRWSAGATPHDVPGQLSREAEGGEWIVIAEGERASVLDTAKATGAEIVEVIQPSLEDIFVARVGKGRGILDREA